MKIRIAVLAVLFALASGCQLTTNFVTGYTPRLDHDLLASRTEARVAVVFFEDARPEKEYTSTAWLFLTYVPIIPFVTMSYERMDEIIAEISEQMSVSGRGAFGARGFSKGLGASQPPAPPFAEMCYPATMAKAVADDIGQYVGKAEYAEKAPAGGFDYVLKGRLVETPYKNWGTSYCLGIAGVLLWMLGPPIGGCTSSTVLDLTLEDPKGRVVWQGRASGSASKLVTLYTSSAIVYGGSGAFSLNVYPCWDDTVNCRSPFAWNFLSLKEGMEAVRGDLIRAIKSDFKGRGGDSPGR